MKINDIVVNRFGDIFVVKGFREKEEKVEVQCLETSWKGCCFTSAYKVVGRLPTLEEIQAGVTLFKAPSRRDIKK